MKPRVVGYLVQCPCLNLTLVMWLEALNVIDHMELSVDIKNSFLIDSRLTLYIIL